MDDVRERLQRPSNTQDIAARIQSLRNILSSERHTTAEQQIALEALDREEADRRLTLERETMEREGTVAPSSLPRPYNDEGYWESQGSTSPASIARERRRGFRPSARLERQRDRMARLARSEPLEQGPSSTSRLSPLNVARTRQASAEQDTEPPTTREGRYPKRRKLDDGTADTSQQRPEYGLEGTLVPGNLKMTVLDAAHPHDPLSQAEELARLNLYMADNKDVFRSKKYKCSILMKHQGGWPFDLSKLVVKIPKHDYDAAPLQGMVFISMNGDTLLEKCSYYDNFLPAYHVLHRRRYDSYRPSQEYQNLTRPPLRHFTRPPQTSEPPNPQWCDGHDELTELQQVPAFDVTVERLSEDIENGVISPRSPRPWHDFDHEYSRRQYALRADSYRPNYAADDRSMRRRVAAAAEAAADAVADARLVWTPSDSEEDEETPLYRGVPPSQRDLEEAEYRQRNILEQMRARRDRGDWLSNLPSSWSGIAHYDDNGEATPDERDHRHGSNASTRTALGPSTEHSSSKRLPGCNEMLQGRSANAGTGDSDQQIMPHAKFQVTREGGGIVINFEPAVSGKYILIKLWTQCPHSSVTLQNIVPYGYAGLRQVPDLSFR